MSRGNPRYGLVFAAVVWVLVFLGIVGGWELGGAICRAVVWGAVVPACHFRGG